MDVLVRAGSVTDADGRTVSDADFGDPGDPDALPVLWCHGGPGCRLESAYVAGAGREAGLRFIGIDRPAALVPGAELCLVPDLGHFSIFDEIVPTLSAALGRV